MANAEDESVDIVMIPVLKEYEREEKLFNLALKITDYCREKGFVIFNRSDAITIFIDRLL